MDLDAVIFDYDGVIVLTEDAWDEADIRFLASHGVTGIDPKVYKPQIVGRSLVQGAEMLGELFGVVGDYELLGEQRFQFAKQALSEKVEFVPGFLEFKKNLKLKSAVATASHPDLFKIVDERLGISKMFDNRVYYISDVGNKSKPEPDIFLYAAKNIGVRPERCAVIEDSPNGILAAKRAGMKAIGITTTFSRDLLSEADIVVDSYSDIEI